MLNFLGPAKRFCDGVSRRTFLAAGSLAVGGLSLADLLKAEETAKSGRNKSVIMVYLSGGIAHQDTFDLKSEAPAEVRGEFKPIDSVVPGMQVCEHLPKLAKCLDRLAVIRSITGLRDEHSSFQSLTGYRMNEAQRDGWPNFGSVVNKVQGQTDPVTPAYVDLFPTMKHRPYNIPSAGYLGRQYDGVRTDGEDLANMKLRYSLERMEGRKRLLAGFDQFRANADDAELSGLATHYRRAFEVLTSSKLVDALDVEKEDQAVRERYGKGSPKHQGDGAPMWNEQLLIARRLVEAGVRVVTVAFGFWDTHGNNFKTLKQRLPGFDQGISALVEDLYARGLDKDVTLVVWGEFGRTPKINKQTGRDHWAPVSNCLLAGGGMPVGQVIGSTDKIGGQAADRPVDYRDVLATVYHNLGIPPHTYVRDVNERPVLILPERARPIRELV